MRYTKRERENLEKKQGTYTAEFKKEVVRPLQTSSKSGAQVARELGISDGSLYTWHKQLAEAGDEAFRVKVLKPRLRKNGSCFGLKTNGGGKKETS